MIHINAIPEDFEPRNKILSKLSEHVSNINEFVLMTHSQSGFLCGVIKKFRPKKILEIGVAAGGSTAIILQAFEDLGEPYEMHSVDITSKCPIIDQTKDTGFLATLAKEKVFGELHGTHEFHLGKFLPQVIDEIGGDIDFVILDTVHFLPGEILDFIAVLPYLKVGAVVVLHDVALNYYERPAWTNAYCTGVLFGAVTAEKFLNFISSANGNNTFFRYPNIAALQTSQQTVDNIDQVFLSLLVNWNYMPQQGELHLYRTHYQRYYPREYVDVFTETIKMNLSNMIVASYN